MRAVKLAFKLPALIIITVLLTALAIGILVTTVLRQYLEDQAREDNLQSVQIYASAIRYYLDDARSILDLSIKRSGFVDFSSSQPIDPILHGLPEEAVPTTRQALRDILATSKTFEYVAFLKEDGSVLMLEPYSLQVKLSTDSLFYTEWYRQLAATGQLVVSNLNISPATQQPTIVIATPIHNSNGRLVGILMGGLKLNELSLIGASSPNSLPLSHVGYLTDNHGLIIAHQAISSYVLNQTDFSSVPAVRLALAGEHGTARYINPIEQVEKLGAYLPLVNPPWAVVYGVPTSVALAPLRELFFSTLLVALGIVFVLGLMSIVIVRQITSPLSRLTSAARLIGAGDLNLRVMVRSSDELGTLAGVFNQMADSLKEKEARLQEYAGGLELKVNQRTAALQASEERYRSLFENMVNGYAYCQMLFDNDQPQDFIYLEVNSVFEKLTGLKDVEGKRVGEVIPGIRESNPEIMEIYARVTQTGIAEEFETYVEGLGIWFSVAVYSPGKETFVAVFDNITVRKLAEDALAKSHAQLLRGEQIGHHGSWEWDIPNDRVVWSDGLYKVFGLSPQEFGATFEAFLERVSPDDQAYVRQVIDTAFREQGAFEFENRIVLPDGQAHNLFTRGELLLDDHNAPARMVGVAMDITERKLAEEALTRSEEQYRELIEQAADGIFISDITGKYVAVNSKGCTMLGYSLEELLGKNLSDLVPIEDNGENPPRLDDLHAGKVIISERRMICKNGLLLPVEISGKMLADGRFQEIVRDITDRKRAEDALRNYSRRLAVINRLDHVISSSLNLDTVYGAFVIEMKELVEFDRTSIVLFDEGCENWQILRQWTSGKPAYQVNSWYPLKGTALAWVIQHQKAYLEEILGVQTEWPEHQGLHKEGLQSRVLLPLIIQGKVTGLLTLASRKPKAYQQSDLELLQTLADQLAIAVQNANLYAQVQLTAEELEQRVLARTAQLEKANKDLESFSYSVSHDLRAPLRAINGFAQILTEFHKENLDEEGQHYLDNVVEASNRMGILIDDLLQYSRVGRASVHRQPVSLDNLFTQILGDFAPRIAETGAIVELPSSGNLPRILSDPTILGQIFSNIIGNALTYHRAGIPPLIRVTYRNEADHHLFGVADNGIGIAAEYLEKIFNVFQRLHSPEDYPGTGIGLAIVKKSAELLGGRVWAESTVCTGSTFWIQIPKE